MYSTPTLPPEQLHAPKLTRNPFSLWIVISLGFLASCLTLTACVLIASQAVLEIAFDATQTPALSATTIATSTWTSTAAPPPTLFAAATPTPSPVVAPTLANWGIAGVSASKTSATSVPSPIPTANNVTFKFDRGVSQQERNVIQRDLAFAQSRLGNTSPITVFAYTNLDDLTTEAAKFYGQSAASTDSMAFREMFSAGKWLANGGSGAISIWVSDRWLKLSPAYKRKTLVHEYFHNVQAAVAKKGVTQTGPIWLYEGAADMVAYSTLVDTGAMTYEQVHADKVTQSRGMLSPLSSLVTLQDTLVEDTEDPYQLGYLAVEYLLAPYGDKSLQVIETFWQAQGSGASWQNAFRNTFGLSVDDFYARFELYRRAQFPSFCGSVGVPLAQATPAPPGIRFVRRLAPGDMPRSEMSWVDPPNIPYVFCATGTKLPWLATSAYTFPSRYVGWISCGANCITIFMRPTDPQGVYKFAIDLPDGRHLQTTFEHKGTQTATATPTPFSP